MLVLWILLAVLLIVLVTLLVTRLVLEIDTVEELYRVRWGPAVFRLLVTGEELRWRFQFLWLRREGPSIPEPGSRNVVVNARPSIAEMKRRKPMTAERRSWLMRAAWNALRSFRVRTFHWRLAPDDVLWSAWLFPLFHHLHVRGHDVAIDFNGRDELRLTIDQTPLRLLWAVVRT